jgi:general secretion pathway protein B
MSYILDALRKLEQNRQHEESLTFFTFHGQAPRKLKRHRLWPYLLVVVLMLNAGVIFWWIVPLQWPGKSMTVEPPAVRVVKPASPATVPARVKDAVQSRSGTEKTIVAPKEVKEQPRSAKRDIIATARSAVQQPSAPKQIPVAEEMSVPYEKPSPALAADAVQSRAGAEKTIVAPREVKEQPRSAKRDIIATVRSAVQQPLAPKQAPVAEETSVPFEKPSPALPVRAEATPPVDGRVLKLADLPASIAGGLPEFKVSLHYYIAEPQSRVVRINDRTLHEGDYLSEGVKVEQIYERGVVMNYRGWRFQMELDRKP